MESEDEIVSSHIHIYGGDTMNVIMIIIMSYLIDDKDIPIR